MFGGEANPQSDPGAASAPATGRFFVNTTWRAPEISSTDAAEGTSDAAEAAKPLPPRHVFGTFSKAVEQLKRASGSSKRSSSALTNKEILTLQSLYVSDIPDHLLDKSIMVNHFSKYGTITRVSISVKRRSCTIHFETHEMAENAKSHGAILNQIALNIFWSRPAVSRRSDRKCLSSSEDVAEENVSVESSSEDTSPSKETLKKQKPILPKFDLPDDVKDELQSMSMSSYNMLDDRPTSLKKTVKMLPKKMLGSSSSESVKKKIVVDEKLQSSSRIKIVAGSASEMESSSKPVSAASVEELQKMMKITAHTPEERYRLLEARDKLMRLKRVRQSDLKRATENCGICPDMCPEKERYHREFHGRVPVYEQLPTGKMDPNKMVKEYSRSSADQEEPLPHELRPAHVLRMTMDYLIWNLMGLCNKKDENLRDWYFYIWDRTRSIRKDVTQQQLCHPAAVTLVEQCARFHVFCSERMIEVEPPAYDDKINTENLTKCLQTLKYMYHDLKLKNISCPNEAEFRAYFILLNLNEGNCMWEVQRLSPEVRQSDPVRFALQVSAALNSNNYNRFFKLVRSSTYLNACILHRYFAQVRLQALSTILKAYCSRVDTVFTLEDVVRLTGFENTQEAALLCSHHGLHLIQDGKGVIFSRSSYCPPNALMGTTRSPSLIEAKYPGSVAEIVSGGVSREVDIGFHIPQDSFDNEGRLKSDIWKTIDQQSKASPLEPVLQESIAEPGREKEVLDKEAQMRKELVERALQKHAEEIANNVISFVVEDEVCSIVEKYVKDAHIERATDELYSEVYNSVTSDLVQGVCQEVVTAELGLARERIRAKQLELEADMRNKLIENKAALEYNLTLDLVIKEICKDVIEEEQNKDEMAKQWSEKILQELVEEECKTVTKEVVTEARAARLEAIRLKVQRRTLEYVFSKWKCYVNRSKILQQSMFDFPAWMSNMSLEEQVAGLEEPNSSFIEYLSERRHQSRNQSESIDFDLPSVPTVNVGSVISHHLVPRMKALSCYSTHLFWKMLVSLPDAREAPSLFDICKRWTERVFSFDCNSVLLQQTVNESSETVNVCLRSVTGPVTDVDACTGVNGVFFWLCHKDISAKVACQRLLTVLSAKPQYPAVPVALLWTGPTSVKLDTDFLVSELALEKLIESNFVSQYKFFRRESNLWQGLASQMEQACQWLARCVSCYPPLVVTSMKQMVNYCVTEELWEHIQAKNSGRNPNTMIEMYNTAILKLREHLSDESLAQYSLGAIEFQDLTNDDYVLRDQFQYQVAPEYWGSKPYFGTISKLLTSAQLKAFPSWPPLSFSDLKEMLECFCTSQGIPQVAGNLYRILEHYHKVGHRSSFPPSAALDWKSFLKSLPWSQIMQTIAEAKLESLDCGFVSRNILSQGGFLVIVHRRSLQHFRCFPWWANEVNTDTTAAPQSGSKATENKVAGVRKRPLNNEDEVLKKQKRLSLADTLREIKATVTKIDSTLKCVKLRREEIQAKYHS